MVLKEVPSGKIELVFNGLFTNLQFNCSCLDALPYCKALCCRMRVAGGATVMLEDDEREKFENVEGALQHDRNGNCVYLNKECKCNVQDDKPKMCTAWHCSPGGIGNGITKRSSGWLLAPMVSVGGV